MHSLYTQAAALTDEVIAAATKVQKHFGIGALESIYVRCLERELQLSGHMTKREGLVKISYRGLEFDENLRYDLLVDNEHLPKRGVKRVIIKGADDDEAPF